MTGTTDRRTRGSASRFPGAARLVVPGGSRLLSLLCLVVILLLLPVSASAELTVTGEKTFQFREYDVRGDFSQFAHANPLALQDRGFDQSLRLEISGTIEDRVHVEVALDDSSEDQEDKKLLVSVDGRVWDATLGRMTLNLPEQKYLLYNRTVLGAVVEGRLGRHRVRVMAGRPEGRAERNFFQGKGTLQEYVLMDRDGLRNPQVVQGSEVVEIDGRVLRRGADYTIDYEEGSIILDARLLPVEESSRITVTFETLASGSTFPSTVLGIRHEVDLGRSSAATSPTSRTYVAWTLLRDADDGSTAATDETSATPRELTVMGVDGAVRLPAGFRVELEGAASRFDPDRTSSDDDVETASALEARLSRHGSRHDVTLSHQRIEPGFRAVGRETFARLGRDADLVSDVEATTLRNEVRLGGVKLTSEVNASRTNLDDAPGRETVEFTRGDHALLAKSGGANLDLRLLEEATERWGGAVEDSSGKRVGVAAAELPVAGLRLSARVEAEDNRSEVTRTEDLVTGKVGLASRPGTGRLGWSASLMAQQVDVDELKERARLNTQAGLTLTGAASKSLSGDLTLSKRVERNFDEADSSRPARADIDTGETSVRWNPSRSLTLSLKGSLEQRSRILAVTDDRDIVLASAEREHETSSTIITDHPVITFTTANSVEWRPGKKWDHRLGYRERTERDLVTGTPWSENEVVDYRGKYAPSRRLRFTADVVDSSSSSLTSTTARDVFESGGQVLVNLAKDWVLTLDGRSTEVDDRVDDLQDEASWMQGAQVEKSVGKSLKARAGLKAIRRDGAADSLENAVDLGVVCTPRGSGLRWELGYKDGAITGTDTAGSPFDSFDRRLTLKLDTRLGDDTRLTGGLDRIAAGPDGKGGMGYRATTAEMKVSVDF